MPDGIVVVVNRESNYEEYGMVLGSLPQAK